MAPTTQSITLEETCLNKYVSEPIETQEADTRIKILKTKVNELNEFLEENSKDIKSFEWAVLRNVKQNKTDYLDEIVQTEIHKNYSELDLSFLSMNHKIKGFKVPRFAVYRYEGNKKFEVEYPFLEEDCTIKCPTKFHRTIKKNLFKKITPKFLPKSMKYGMIMGALVGSFAFYKAYMWDMEISGTTINGISALLLGLLGGGIGTWMGAAFGSMSEGSSFPKFSTEFNGLIPKKTKVKAEKAKEDFGEELYLITETKPEDWKQKKIISDPLLIGVLNDKSYLIDHFDCTSMENYIRKEFTS